MVAIANEGKFTVNKKYYRGVVYEWNLPTGSSCPCAKECKVTVDRDTGKFDIAKGQYRCYAAGPERFPGVREYRWRNFDFAKKGGKPKIPEACKAIRIHAAGDFFNQKYFDTWLEVAAENPSVEMWAYTKSLSYWTRRIDQIPANLTLTASYGGTQDHLIDEYGLKNVKVYACVSDVPQDRPIDHNDDFARHPGVNFALIDNYSKPKKLAP